MKPFRVIGHFQMGQNRSQPFTKQFAAKDEESVRERVYSELGSRHGVPRRNIVIKEVQVIGDDEDFDPIVRYLVQKGE